MSEKEYVLKTLNYVENAFKYLVGVLSAIVVFLVFNFDGSTVSILASIVAFFCVLGLINCAFLLKKYLRRLRSL
ncbi:hypothetical protein [Succinivibrio dextrinosolvens]|uniref:hypothetical protein n=1 Tax=Succinivibrio dextrinosolvens TaxID=83771 RepID=UPI00241D94E0|nr:hypothetical protein [Succinivibrio dextrinosolvens]MBE6424306.1 hypothetical protein [Succinivibrio dextrinosolvens]